MSLITVALAIALARQPDFVVRVREPRAASPWFQSTEAKCQNSILHISGYGLRNPANVGPTITVSGRPLTGNGLPQLIADLSNRRAVYRLQILCSHDGTITVRIGMGEKRENGAVEFKSSAAFIKGRRLHDYTGFEPADADSFWFR